MAGCGFVDGGGVVGLIGEITIVLSAFGLIWWDSGLFIGLLLFGLSTDLLRLVAI